MSALILGIGRNRITKSFSPPIPVPASEQLETKKKWRKRSGENTLNIMEWGMVARSDAKFAHDSSWADVIGMIKSELDRQRFFTMFLIKNAQLLDKEKRRPSEA